jgi:hypothetical protein
MQVRFRTTVYLVESSHRSYAPLQHRTMELAVTDNGDGTRYVAGSPLGCSRDYRTDSDYVAIRALLAEHGASLVHAEPCAFA